MCIESALPLQPSIQGSVRFMYSRETRVRTEDIVWIWASICLQSLQDLLRSSNILDESKERNSPEREIQEIYLKNFLNYCTTETYSAIFYFLPIQIIHLINVNNKNIYMFLFICVQCDWYVVTFQLMTAIQFFFFF